MSRERFPPKIPAAVRCVPDQSTEQWFLIENRLLTDILVTKMWYFPQKSLNTVKLASKWMRNHEKSLKNRRWKIVFWSKNHVFSTPKKLSFQIFEILIIEISHSKCGWKWDAKVSKDQSNGGGFFETLGYDFHRQLLIEIWIIMFWN